MNGRLTQILLAGLASLLTAACSTPTPVYLEDDFGRQTPYQHKLPVTAQVACDGARHALLSQGYQVDDSRMDHLKGTKQFQPDSETHMVMEFNVVCAKLHGAAMMYANARQSRYDLKKSLQSAGISLPTLGSLSLPWGSTTESLVKVGGETVSDPELYQRFFELVEEILRVPPESLKVGDEDAPMRI